MTPQTVTAGGIAYDRAGPSGNATVLLLHAGVADRGMWQPQWDGLVSDFDVVRIDLRGFGASSLRPQGALSAVGDVVETLAELAVERCHVVGASLGAGVAVELALARPDLVASLMLVAPGGSLITDSTPDLETFIAAERAALVADDLDAAVEANLRTWVDGPYRAANEVDAGVRASIARMQRRAFEITADWDDVEELDSGQPAADRLAEIAAPVLILAGLLDLDVCLQAAALLTADIPQARRVDWPDVAHFPSLERPADFLTLLRGWLTSHDQERGAAAPQ